jgi:hypothetical protein
METTGRLRLADVFVSIQDPRQVAKVDHDLVELLVVAVNAVLVAADSFVEIELWAKEKLDWLRGYANRHCRSHSRARRRLRAGRQRQPSQTGRVD